VTDVNLWAEDAHARAYLERADLIPRRAEAEGALLQCVPLDTTRVLDLGSGDGRLLARVLEPTTSRRRCSDACGTALPAMPG
jgi:hypothetical protein